MNKKLIFLFSFTLLLQEVRTQNNLSFEMWYSAGTYEEPSSWTTFNFFKSIGEPLSAFKSNFSTNGNSSLQLTSIATSTNNYIPGSVFQKGKCNSFSPLSFSLDYKYNGSINDSSFISVLFFKNKIHSDSVVGQVSVMFDYNSNWSSIKRDVEWFSNNQADSFLISIINSPLSTSDTLFLDNIRFNNFKSQIENFNNWNAFLNKFKSENIQSMSFYTLNGACIEINDLNTDVPENEVIIYFLTTQKNIMTQGKIINLK